MVICANSWLTFQNIWDQPTVTLYVNREMTAITNCQDFFKNKLCKRSNKLTKVAKYYPDLQKHQKTLPNRNPMVGRILEFTVM